MCVFYLHSSLIKMICCIKTTHASFHVSFLVSFLVGVLDSFLFSVFVSVLLSFLVSVLLQPSKAGNWRKLNEDVPLCPQFLEHKAKNFNTDNSGVENITFFFN